MKVNHDYHIHTGLSSGTFVPEQTTDRILQYAVDEGFDEICMVDHLWDEQIKMPIEFDWYKNRGRKELFSHLPLPTHKNIKFFFGCETELAFDNTLGISPDLFDKLDFIIIPTTHMHLYPFTVNEEMAKSLKSRAEAWVNRFDAVLNMDLPFEKIGFAHLTSHHIVARGETNNDEVLDLISTATLKELFSIASKKGVGIELNISPFSDLSKKQLNSEMRIYKIAKEVGCKFYFGGDTHRPAGFSKNKSRFFEVSKELNLTENDRYYIPR